MIAILGIYHIITLTCSLFPGVNDLSVAAACHCAEYFDYAITNYHLFSHSIRIGVNDALSRLAVAS